MSPVAEQVLPSDWACRRVQPALSAERLAVLLEDTALRSGELLFTSAAATQLDEAARWQRLEDLAWCGKARVLADLQTGADAGAGADPGSAVGEFVGDEVALALGVGPVTAGNLVGEALELTELTELPGLLEAVETGRLSVRHVKAVLQTLHDHHDLTPDQRARLVNVLLGRLDTLGGGGGDPRAAQQAARSPGTDPGPACRPGAQSPQRR